MPKANKKKDKKITGAPARTVRTILRGGVVNSDFFYRHKLKIFLGLVLVMFYISTKYQCQTGMETIQQLQTDLDVVKTETIRQKATYMSRIRESAMSQLADSIRPGLCIQSQPPFQLKLNH